MLKNNIAQEINSALKKAGFKNINKTDFHVTRSKFDKFGDFSVNILDISQKLNLVPNRLAEKIVKKINNKDILIEYTPNGYLNFKISSNHLKQNLVNILTKKSKDDVRSLGKNEIIVIDYSSPNIAKPMGVGHLRSTILGQSLVNIYRYLGYKVIGDNHVGDWGTQFGKIILAYKKWSKIKLEKLTIKNILDLYIKFHLLAKDNHDLEQSAQIEFKKLEDGDKENTIIWKKIKNLSLKEFEKIYKILDIHFDKSLPESFYLKMAQNVISEALKNKIAILDQGAVIISLVDENFPPLLIRKKDEATLYATRDLACLDYRINKFKARKIIYVVGNEQNLYMRQLFASARKLQFEIELTHVNFGLIRLGTQKMSTRSGNIIYLEDLICKSIEKAKKVIIEKNPKISSANLQKTAEAIGVSAVKYNDLSQNRNTDINFSYDKMMSQKGNSALYLFYAYARAKSVLRKSKNNIFKQINCDSFDKFEEELLRTLLHFHDSIIESAENFSPNIIADYIFKLAEKFNNFYENVNILKAQEDKKILRLAIVSATAETIKSGLDLLGIKVLEKI